MNLKGYLANNNMTIKKFAEVMQCSPNYLSSVMHHKRTPSPRFARDLYIFTNGEVKIDPAPRKKRQKIKQQENIEVNTEIEANEA